MISPDCHLSVAPDPRPGAIRLAGQLASVLTRLSREEPRAPAAWPSWLAWPATPHRKVNLMPMRIPTLAELNEINRDFWHSQRGKRHDRACGGATRSADQLTPGEKELLDKIENPTLSEFERLAAWNQFHASLYGRGHDAH